MHFKKNDKIGSYTVAFPHKQGSYAETYRGMLGMSLF